MVWASSDSGEYPIFVGEGLLGGGYWPLDGRRFCVTDTTVADLYADRLEPLAGQVAVEPGEQAKTLPEAERVLRELTRLGMTRSDHLVALGGGVVGDLAGFCAATYQRGVPVVQVPTTLVAQVDSAIGGKTGVDLPEAKNYVGAYHLPAAVLADTGTLATLPAEELAAGWAEVIKTGLLAGGALWERVRSTESPDAAGPDGARLRLRSLQGRGRGRGRARLRSPRDPQSRPHGRPCDRGGDRVPALSPRRGGGAWASRCAAALASADTLREEVRAMLQRAGLPTQIEDGVEPEAILAALERDKKRDAAGVRFVLLSRPGEPREGELVEPDRVRDAIEELLG